MTRVQLTDPDREVVGELPVVHVAAAVPERPLLPTPRTGSAEVREIGQDAAASFAEQVVKVLAGHAGPVRCRRVAEGLGLEIRGHGVRHSRGWVSPQGLEPAHFTHVTSRVQSLALAADRLQLVM